MKIYCPTCDKETIGKVIKKEETFSIKGEKTEIISSIFRCSKCGSDIFDETLDEKNIEIAYNKYREKHGLLFPLQIKEIREKYGLSQRGLSNLLEWGEITVHRYEAGGLQDKVHDELLKLIAEPANMAKIFNENKKNLPIALRVKLEKKLKETLKESAGPELKIAFGRYFENKAEINEFSGYKKFNLEKTKNMVLCILEKIGKTYKTKLNKLFWYVDFYHFKRYSVSISGSFYIHLPYGPIPDDYEWIIGEMLQEGLIDKEEVTWKSQEDISGERFKVLIHCDRKSFSENELGSIDYILSKLGGLTSSQLKDRSHKETPYLKTKKNERISYNFTKYMTF